MDKFSLVVASAVKKYIKENSDNMHTSAAVMAELTEKIKKTLDVAIVLAMADGRKTVMDRDIPKPGAQL